MKTPNGYLLIEFMFALGLIALFFPIALFTWGQTQKQIRDLIHIQLSLSELRYLHSLITLELLQAKTITVSDPTLSGTLTNGISFLLQITPQQFRLAHGGSSAQPLTHQLNFTQAKFEKMPPGKIKLTLHIPSLSPTPITLPFAVLNVTP